MIKYANIELNNSRCNFDCSMCTVNKSKSYHLTLDKKKSYLQELQDSGAAMPDAVVCFLKGEPLMNIDELCELVTFCNQIGYKSILVTNGSLLNPENTERLISCGLKNIRVSLDSHIEDIFTQYRNSTLFEQIIKNIKSLADYKKSLRYTLSLGAHIVVTSLNISHIKEYLAFCEYKLGVDLVNLLFLDRMIVGDPKENFYKKYFINDVNLLENVLIECKDNPLVNLSENDIGYILEYHRRINFGDRDHTYECKLCDFNSVFDTEGHFQHCYLFGSGRQKYLERGDFKKFILPRLNHNRNLIRKSKCNDYCFIIGYNSIKVFENGVI